MILNTPNRYGLVAIVLHWLMALGVIGMFGLGLYMVELTYYDNWYHGSLEFHKAVGVLLALVFLARLIWRQFNTVPTGLADKAIANKAAHWMHLGLYLVMAALFVSGYLISTADGRAVDVFGLFSVPATLTDRGSQEEIAGQIHELLAWSLAGMVALHALAALKHHVINKDNTLKRMLRP
ncbi:cytochrome b [Oceanobacter sp. 3_MG-2023]|uniref:cytochrome b n=1 Tax=Oceanobacter sp. 3_MG-2023 TaxID=3062622 RepID=UPI002737507F|nr:cytochrome b [Oceanobacter sp. 3_MG-2023]MDP2504661.1 cytochrome b [Oceanobacter sp. 3_MG-2023]